MGKFPPSKQGFSPSTDVFATHGSALPPQTTTTPASTIVSTSQFDEKIITTTGPSGVVASITTIESVVNAIASGNAPIVPMGATTTSSTKSSVDSSSKMGVSNDTNSGKKKQKIKVNTTNVSSKKTTTQEVSNKIVIDAMMGTDERIDVSNDKFTLFEKVTGLSQERPEVIQMMNYLPLFEKGVGSTGYTTSDPVTATNAGFESSADYGFTPAGSMFDTLYKQRLIKIDNMQKTFNVIARRGNLSNTSEFEKAVNDVTVILRTMFGLTQLGAVLKTVLGIRDTTCNFKKTVALLIKGELRQAEDKNDQNLLMYDDMMASLTMSPLVAKGTATIPQVLNLLGYDLNAAKNVFSSTKLWFQLLYELRVMLRFSSDQLLNASTQAQQSDVDPLVVNKHTLASTRLGGRPIRYTLPKFENLTTLTTLSDINSINQFIDSLLGAYSDTYAFVGFDSGETKIAALSNLLSQEYRYSYVLKQPHFKDILRNEYGYTVIKPGDDGTNNVAFIDAVLGNIPNNVTSIVANNSNQSLVSVAQQIDSRTDNTRTVSKRAVLPMEMKFLETGNSAYTPGGVYLVDEVLSTANGKDFNIDQLQSYYDVVDRALKSFIPVTLGCDMYMFGAVSPGRDDAGEFRPESAAVRQMFGDPKNLFVSLFKMLAPVSTATSDNPASLGVPDVGFDGFGKEGWHDSAVWSLFSYATKNERVLALLFSILLTHISIKGSSLVTSDRKLMLDALMHELEQSFASAPNTSTNVEMITKKNVLVNAVNETYVHSTTENAIRNALQDGNVVKFLAEKLSNMSVAVKNLLQGESRTMFSGMPEAFFDFLIFELMCMLIDNYGRVHLKHVSPASTQNSQLAFQYVVRNSTVDHSPSNVFSRLELERARVQGTLLAATSVITEIGFGLKTFLSALTPTVKTQAAIDNNLYATLGSQALQQMNSLFNDPMYVNLMLGEQQLMTALNGVYDIKTQIDRASNVETAYAIIDDAADDPNKTILLDVMYSVFSDKKFQSQNGYNNRIISVGLPSGFTHNFKHGKSNVSKDVNDSNSKEYTNKVNDVIRVVVRKIDVRYNEIVFKPQSFLFDLSRYPARTAKLLRKDDQKNITFQRLSSYVGTRDFGKLNALAIVPAKVEYYSDTNSPKNYPFLSMTQCAELYRNHALSYLLEVYVRIMTGLNVSENAFTFRTTMASMFKPDKAFGTLSEIVNAGVGNSKGVRDKKKVSVLPGAAKYGNISSQKSSDIQQTSSPAENTTVNTNVGSVMASYGTMLDQGLSTSTVGVITSQIAQYVRTFSTMSNDVYAKQRMLLPKHFDRVFNIVLDPDDFEIDVTLTKASPAGAQALDSLVEQGEFVEKLIVANETGNQDTISYVSRQKSGDDVAFEKYIVNIESFEDDGV